MKRAHGSFEVGFHRGETSRRFRAVSVDVADQTESWGWVLRAGGWSSSAPNEPTAPTSRYGTTSDASRLRKVTMASSRAWREIWVRPEVRVASACGNARAPSVATPTPPRRTLNFPNPHLSSLLTHTPDGIGPLDTRAHPIPLSPKRRSTPSGRPSAVRCLCAPSSAPDRSPPPQASGAFPAPRFPPHTRSQIFPPVARGVPARVRSVRAARAERPRAYPLGARRDGIRRAATRRETPWQPRAPDVVSKPGPSYIFPPRPPETRSVWKDGRAEGVHEGKARVKEGEQWREHTVRKFMRNVRPQIFPDLNDSMSK